ncbi:hypothetical protein Btru_032975 [Bulinus truncatus]|nr:hypothetical protein Btru_032975 [Bulinus truncatus]
MPSKGSVLIALSFICVGLILGLCDRWPEKLKVQGTSTKKPHIFDHLFLLWFLKQFLQLLLLPLWYLIDKNKLGFGVLMHGRLPETRRAIPLANVAAVNEVVDDGNAADQGLIHNVGDDDQNQPLIHVNPKRRHKSPSVLIYLPAAFFAQASILLLYFGLKLTYGSSFIMLKGTVAFFTALLAMAFLAQQLAFYVWFGVFVATMGFAVSGISDYIHVPSEGYEKYGIAAGDLLIVMSQIMFATKIIYEEKFLRKHSIHPMFFLGAEATYGFVSAGIFLTLFNLLDLVQYSYLPNGRMEDIVDAWYQLSNSWECSLAFSGSLVFYIIYTYLGMFLIRDHGALARIMIETFIWAIYWAICLALGWENFFIAQVPGLCVIPIGVLIYSHILVIPICSGDERNGLNLGQNNDNQGNIQGNRLDHDEPAGDGNGDADNNAAGAAAEENQEDQPLLNHEVRADVHNVNGDDQLIEA